MRPAGVIVALGARVVDDALNERSENPVARGGVMVESVSQRKQSSFRFDPWSRYDGFGAHTRYQLTSGCCRHGFDDGCRRGSDAREEKWQKSCDRERSHVGGTTVGGRRQVAGVKRTNRMVGETRVVPQFKKPEAMSEARRWNERGAVRRS